MFSSKGIINISAVDEYGDVVIDADKLMEDALECGAEDFAQEDDNLFVITTAPEDLETVKNALSELGYQFLSAEVEKVPSSYVTLTNEDDIVHLNRLLDALDDDDDVQNVWHNWDE